MSSKEEDVDLKIIELDSPAPPTVRKRKLYWPFSYYPPPPPPPPSSSPSASTPLPPSPEATARLLSRLTWSWLTPLLSLGYQRPLHTSDLFILPPSISCTHLSRKLSEGFERRQLDAAAWNERLEEGKSQRWERVRRRTQLFLLPFLRVKGEAGKGERGLKKEPLLVMAMNDAIGREFWIGGAMRAVSDVIQVCTPLISKEIILFAQRTHAARTSSSPTPTQQPSIGKGLSYCFALLALQLLASQCSQQGSMIVQRATIGARGAIVASVFERSMERMNAKDMDKGRLMNHIGVDVGMVDGAMGFFHIAWTSVIQFIIILAFLLHSLGPSALAGVGFVILSSPLQGMIMGKMAKMRKGVMEVTDRRSRLTREVMNGIKLVKLFAWERPFVKKMEGVRREELQELKKLLTFRAITMAVYFGLPSLSAVISIIVYSSIHSDRTLDPAIIFPSISWFFLLRIPLTYLPLSLSFSVDGWNAIRRLQKLFVLTTGKEKGEGQPALVVDDEAELAIEIEGGRFTWDGDADSDGSRKELKDICLRIARGKLVAIVGPVGSGKSSLLAALTGEMKKLEGKVKLGAEIAYVPQIAWIQNASLRDNVLFGQPFEEERYWSVIQAACLEPDLEVLPDGDLTDIGEKGINLSGGQRQRVSIARAMYFQRAGLVLLDDPLSAVDAHVAETLLNHAIKRLLADRTRILVTHNLNILHQVDYVICLDQGSISEQGTYEELVQRGDVFARLIAEFGRLNKEDADREVVISESQDERLEESKVESRKRAGKKIIQEEDRASGSVAFSVYVAFAIAGGAFLGIVLLLSLALFSSIGVLNNYWLVWWEVDAFNQSRGFYISIYGGLGFAQTLFSFLMGLAGVIAGYQASKRLHNAAFRRVIRAPQYFFDTTPLGRILPRFSSDVNVLDNSLNGSIRIVLSTFGQLAGILVIIAIVLPWFIAPLAVISAVFFLIAKFHRPSAREIKRSNNLLRSGVAAHFSESIAGTSTIRAYGETARFVRDNQRAIDLENSAYYLSYCNQHWLGVRLDIIAMSLTLSVTLLSVGLAKTSVTPAQVGLVLSYVTQISQALGFLVRESATLETEMNNAERLIYYAHKIVQEAPAVVKGRPSDLAWPETGSLSFKDVRMIYRRGLPEVLHRVSFEVKAGEKIGICGRTGSGKTSLLMALFRVVELASGSIEVDGEDISKMGLETLRSRLAIIPQEPLLFNGTLRSNLDPFGEYDDARLNDAIKHCHLNDSPTHRFHLDTKIEDEGANLSVGERALVSLARAIVKDSKIYLIDEATSSIDQEKDSKIQETIRCELKDKVVMCIAHRLETIIGYDRILVMNEGKIAEFDSPERLALTPSSLFGSMCSSADISLADIQAAQSRSGFHRVGQGPVITSGGVDKC
ncbi:P-loop containing nucleoside triphosphate hydrolase protein [Atractiella rhizophila]|nr:P-loop containing nucleoside triphosphate hydrolase protein [Atractiella rhizophila]